MTIPAQKYPEGQIKNTYALHLVPDLLDKSVIEMCKRLA